MSNLSFVHPEAKVAASAVIEPFAYVDKNVEIGEGTWIGPHTVVMSGARIGKNCKIFPGAVISAIPQDLKFIGEESVTIIGDNTSIRECVTINRGTQATGKTVVGNNCLIMAYVHIGHDSVVGNNCVLVNNVTLAGHVIVEDWAILNGMVGVQQFITIGAHTYVSGGSFARKNVPPFVRCANEPLSYAGINSVGLLRRGFTQEKVNEIQDIYRHIFLKDLALSKAVESVEANFPQSAERDLILNFIKNSPEGIIKSPGSARSGLAIQRSDD